MPDQAIHASAIISKRAEIGKGVKIGPFSIIEDGVILEDGTEIGSHCAIGIDTGLAKSRKLHIGPNSVIRSHSRFYIGSDFSKGVVTGHGVSVRENTVAGARCQLGTLTDIQGDVIIGDHLRTHSNVHVGKHSHIGNFVWIFPYVVLTNDPHPPSNVVQGVTVGDYSAIATMSVVLPGVALGKGCLIGAGSVVTRDVPDGMIAAGVPAEIKGPASKIKLRDGSGRDAYPWPAHFQRGYPDEVVQQWQREFGKTG